MEWLDGITNLMGMGMGELQEFVMDREACRAVVHGITESDSTEWLNWTELEGLSHTHACIHSPPTAPPIQAGT